MSARASASDGRAAPAAARARIAALVVGAAALAACGHDTASAAAGPASERPAEAVRDPAPPAAGGPRPDMLGVTRDDDPVPPAPWLALELRFVEHDSGGGAGARTTLARLEEGVLRTRTHDARAGHEEPELEATVVLDEASALELAASMRDAALLGDLVDVSELEAPAAGGHVEVAAVLERDAVRTRVVLERPATPRGVAALAAMERVVDVVRRATTPPAPPP